MLLDVDEVLGAKPGVAPAITGVDARHSDRPVDRGHPLAVAADDARDLAKAAANRGDLEVTHSEADRRAPSLRPGRTNRSFVMTAQTVETDAFGNPRMHWQYIEYGHGPSPYVAPPSVQITAPADHSSFRQGTSVTYSANVNGPVDGTLPSAAIVWAEDGSAIGSGPTIHHIENTIGTHTITVTATNGDGKSASQSITIGVNAPPVKPLPPSVSITAPPNGDRVFCRSSSTPVAVQFTATASDPNSPPESLTYSWTDSINGGAPSQVSTQLSPSLNLACDQATPRGTTHELTVTATNTSGESASAQVQVIATLG
jgi:hypothetical protein